MYILVSHSSYDTNRKVGNEYVDLKKLCMIIYLFLKTINNIKYLRL